jgi:glucosamine--fructose-6-phosphate aminotransferase (isomerizing)
VSYTTAVLALAMLAAEVGAETTFTSDKLALVPGSVRNAIENPGIDQIPIPTRIITIFGAGPASVTAREGALKIRESARSLAEGMDVEYLLHGSAVPLTRDDHLIALVTPDDDGFVEAVAKAGEAEGIGVSRLAEPSPLPVLLAQIPLTVRLQMLALRIATSRGQDPDKVIVGHWDDPGLWALGGPDS